MSFLHERPHVFQQEETLKTVMAGPSGTSHTKYRSNVIRDNNKFNVTNDICRRLRQHRRKRRWKHIFKLLYLCVRINAKYSLCDHQRTTTGGCGRRRTDPLSNVFGTDPAAKGKTIGSTQGCRRRHLWWPVSWSHVCHQHYRDKCNCCQQQQLLHVGWWCTLLNAIRHQFRLHIGTKGCNARITCPFYCRQVMAMARFDTTKRTETKFVVSKSKRYRLQLLQSRTLESHHRKR